MRYLALVLPLLASPSLAQTTPATGETPADPRIAAAIEAYARQISLPNTLWASASASWLEDRRAGQRGFTASQGAYLGYEHRITGMQNPLDQLLLGVAIGPAFSSLRKEERRLRSDSRGISGTLYAVYSPVPFLSFPVSVSLARWQSDQQRGGTPLLPVYRAGYASTSFASSAAVALTLPVAPFLITPSVGHRYAGNAREGFNEAINPAGTVFEHNRAAFAARSQLFADLRVLLPVGDFSLWTSIGYGHALKRTAGARERGEIPLGFGMSYSDARWQISLGAGTLAQANIAQFGLNGALRYRF